MNEENNKEKKHIFIDTNIFLDFYRLSEKDLKEIKKLLEYIKSGEIKIYLTQQIRNEFYRNRETVFSNTFNEFVKTKDDDSLEHIFSLNNILKGYQEYNNIKKIKKMLGKVRSELVNKIQDDIINKNLSADKIIKNIFEKAGVENSDSFLDNAEKRLKLGNPPGKNNSLGDAINWEFLLEAVPQNQDLIVISRDGDFVSFMDKERLHPFLDDEWKENKKSKIYFYNSLSNFFNNHDIKIKLEDKELKDFLIEKLDESRNFLNTHSAIDKLSRYDFFDDYQIKNLANALLTNSQISWIADDLDVKNFYKSILKDKLDIFDSDTRSRLESYIFPENNEVNKEIDDLIKNVSESDGDFVEIPF